MADTTVDTVDYDLSGDTLYLMGQDSPGRPDTMVLLRQGTGSGLEGTWKPTEPVYTMEGQPRLQMIVYVSEDRIEFWVPRESFFESFTEELAVAFEPIPTLEMETTGGGNATLTGTITGEVVTFSVDDHGNLLISSSSPANQSAVLVDMNEYVDPSQCPVAEPEFPPWFILFLFMNGATTIGM
jgi:hypothetical protein